MNKKLVLALMGMTAAGIASAANINVAGQITGSTTWTANNVYCMTNMVTVMPGATLTIQAGTVCKSLVDGSLTVVRGGKIYVNGTKTAPVIMTSTNDNLTTLRASCNEWGNLTILGKGLISTAADGTGTGQPDGTDTAQMEGLTATNATDPNVIYGGNDDNDDSGSIHYLSLRYGGRTLSAGIELNGLSLGGIGRATDIDHVEIMNNLDDGIEIWGGTVNLKYVNIWNVGDDSFDIDCGWRGKAQFGLIVQGYSKDAKQGGGIGDNCIEMDGAESASAQPFGNALFYNFTVIGQNNNASTSGDHATEWRDNERAQFHNTIFMSIGQTVVKNAISDGEPGHGLGSGYGLTGNPTLSNLFRTAYNDYPTNTAGVSPAVLYSVFSSGNMCEFKDCLFFETETNSLYSTEFDVMNAANRNQIVVSAPVVSVQRDAPITLAAGSDVDHQISPVTNINPCAANAAVSCSYTAPNDGFLTSAPFIGGFSANNNWLKGWTAVDAYGMTSGSAGVDPSTTIQLTASTFFPTTVGVVYTVEESNDMMNWAPVATITGDGSIKSATDLDAFDSAKFYRAIVL
jgi:hypothetical protein